MDPIKDHEHSKSSSKKRSHEVIASDEEYETQSENEHDYDNLNEKATHNLLFPDQHIKKRRHSAKCDQDESQSIHSDGNNENNKTSSPCVKGDFHLDTGLCDMFYDESRNVYNKPYSVIIDQSVLSGILDHVYSDPTNEVIGLLGGTFDEKMNSVHVRHYYSSSRNVANIAVDGVECDGNEIVRASNVFSEKGMNFLGWYHSHPRIPPFPSMKDLMMQKEMQNQAPYAFGIICSAYYDGLPSKYGSDKHNFYFNSFRTRINQKNEIEALRVMCIINEQIHLSSDSQRQMQATLRTVFYETKETFKYLIKSIEKGKDALNKPKQLFLTSQYQSFLTSFWKNSITQSTSVLNHDIRNLKAHNQKLLEKIAAKRKKLEITSDKDDGQYDGHHKVKLEIARVLNTHHKATVDAVRQRASAIASSQNDRNNNNIAHSSTLSTEPDANTASDALLLQNVFNNNMSQSFCGFYFIDGPFNVSNDHAHYEKFALRSESIKINDVICYTTSAQGTDLCFMMVQCIKIHNQFINASPDEQFRHVWIWGDPMFQPSTIGESEFYEGELILSVQAPITLSLSSLHNLRKVRVYQYETFIQKKFGEESYEESSIYGCSRQISTKDNGMITPVTIDFPE